MKPSITRPQAASPEPPEPPTNGGEPVPPTGTVIGSQHGITAYAEWLRKQPNVPQRGPGYDPNNKSTWPWVDKLERTLTILATDHDAGLSNE